ncbi:sodium- and chloride-dependent taurine transporter-like isoform X2 [Mercenaria mercenaria]|uniref:sodium- and chloride-dependent taurine transporter-like isoform X2 n=1 Tax=Mercenaria mercenaria TaxID=6596 RepID=UPI00234E4855|nr:sodium- and chloride-dependent taurine transporter-like isoform X2 [Mercenaria mercenaria]
MDNEMKTFIPSTDVLKNEENNGIRKRETWSRKLDFLIACCGFSIGFGNVWRFPFLCYKNGGGAFLLPYFLCCIIGGIPTFFLEVSVGQFMSEGGMNAWKICPLFQGFGMASAVIIFLSNCYYNLLLSWAFYYLFASLTTRLPWSHCDNEWNTPECTAGYSTEKKCVLSNKLVVSNVTNLKNITHDPMLKCNNEMMSLNVSPLPGPVADVATHIAKTNETYVSDPVTEFWERKVLDISEGVQELGMIKWDICLCLILAWIVVYFCIWKGIRSSGKVMYVTVSSPYILMMILLIRGLTLDGAVDGIKYYLVPDFSKLLKLQVWADAGNQVFYSYSLSVGTLTALGSYNKFDHNAYRDSFLFALVNSMTSFLAGFVIFSVLGFMALKQNVSIDQVAESGPGLAFIAYPEAVAQMPLAPFWSAVFFLMLILLGLDSQFGGVEAVVTCVVDLYPNVFRKGYRREVLVAVICLISFLIGLSMVCQRFSGINRFYDNLEMMYGRRVFPAFKLFWTFLTPIFILFLFIVGVISYSELKYDRKSVEYHYPQWAIGIGWVMALASIVWIPIVGSYRIYQAEGTFLERIKEATKPKLRKHQLRAKEDFSKINYIGTECTLDIES